MSHRIIYSSPIIPILQYSINPKTYYSQLKIQYFMTIVDTASKINTMEIRGAGKIARAAAGALKEFIEDYTGTDQDRFRTDLLNASEILKNTRPTAVSLENALNAVITGTKGSSLSEMRQNGINAAETFIQNSFAAVDKIAELIAEKIKPGYTVLTHCNSTVVVKGLIKAKQQNKDIHVFATETRPWGQGYITSKTLAKEGVDVTLIVDSAANSFLNLTDMVLFGADTITKDGTLINKIGTSQIAVAAKEKQIQVYACAESYKFSRILQTGDEVVIEERKSSEIIEPNRVPGVKIRNPVFDRTPSRYLTAVLTEFGELLPGNVKDFIEKLNSC